MTREEAIEKLKGFDLIGSNEDIEFQEALDIAIKSLEMWDSDGLKSACDIYLSGFSDGLESAFDIIEKHLKEIEE